MKLKSLFDQKSELIFKALFVLLIISAFLPFRHVFDIPQNFITGAYSDFTSFSIYSCDLLILGLLILLSLRGEFKQKPHALLLALVTWVIFVFLLNFKQEISLNVYFIARIIELIVLHETLRQKGYKYKEIQIKTFVLLGAFESILAILQIYYQKSIGLYLIGEQHIDVWTSGIAKIGLETGKFLRAYGTFPHSNLLSAFLLVAVFFNLYLLVKNTTKSQRIIISANLGLTILGLFLTFSRAAILSLAISLTIFFLVSLIKVGLKKHIAVPAIIVALCILASTLVLKPLLLARTQFLTDQSGKERIFYAKLGWEMIKDRPMVGVGIGTSALRMQDYSPTKLQPWEVQPIHNYFLLSAAELGIPGALILIILFLLYIKKLLQRIKNSFSIYQVTLLSILSGFLILMLFDHYFYTIEQTQILLWLILGLTATEISEKQKTSH